MPAFIEGKRCRDLRAPKLKELQGRMRAQSPVKKCSLKDLCHGKQQLHANLAFGGLRDFPKQQLLFHALGMEGFLLLMQQSVGLRGQKLPTKAACEQEERFHFQCT